MNSRILEISRVLGVNMLYTRKEQGVYDKSAVLEFNPNYKNKRV